MSRLVRILALILALIAGFQVAVCADESRGFVAPGSGPVLQPPVVCDCDGCACCRLCLGFAATAEAPPETIAEYTPAETLNQIPQGNPSNIYHPPRA